MNFRSINILQFIAVIAFSCVFSFIKLNTQSSNAVAINYSLNIQPIYVCNNSGSNCASINLFEAETKKIWKQAGIRINFLSPIKISNTNFLSIDTDDEFRSLVSSTGNGHLNSQTLNMWFIKDLFPDNGRSITRGYSYINGNGIVINSSAVIKNNRLDTIAHEIGHNLGLGHYSHGAGGINNLMTSGNTRMIPTSICDIYPTGSQLDVLTPEQISVVTNSPLLTPIPEHVIIVNSLVLNQ